MAEIKSKLIGRDMMALEKNLATYKGEDEMISSKEMAELLAKEPKASFSFSTGIYHLDLVLNNVEAGELVIITGPTGEGKTSLMMTISKFMAENQTMPAWFELELTGRQFFSKFDFNPPLFYLPKRNIDNTIFWLEERILEAIVKYDIKSVFIDDLHHLFSLARIQSNVSFEIGDVIAKLKDIAVLNNLVIFLQVHIKDPQDATTREPILSDIRDSGLIKALADTVIGIWRVKNETVTKKDKRARREEIGDNDSKAKVRVWKNRREGKMSTFYLKMENRFFVESYDKDGYPQDGTALGLSSQESISDGDIEFG